VLLVEAARSLGDCRFLVLARNWGKAQAWQAGFAKLRAPENVVLKRGDVPDMSREYRQAHVVAALYADGFGKACPNSVIEGLACGCPAILSQGVGISDLVSGAGAGLIASRTPEDVVQAVAAIRADYARYCRRARALAESEFSEVRFVDAYRDLYRDAVQMSREESRRTDRDLPT
jgi:glycosyltransferase involved in cell wall biosynthesis